MDDRTPNGTAAWWNHDDDPNEQRILDLMQQMDVSCGELGYHHHDTPGHPIGKALLSHHHHDEKCLFQAGINAMKPQIESQRRQIADMNDAMDQIHRIAFRNGSPKGRASHTEGVILRSNYPHG